MTLSPIDPALRIVSVHLAVSDLARSVDFYERVLGLPLISSDEEQALLGPDSVRPLLWLTRIAHPTFVPRGSTGLFHVAYLYPTRRALAEGVLRVAHNRWPIDGVADHGVSEAIYLSDPDGLGIEIYADRPREQWSRPASGHGVNMVTLPLDIDGLLALASDGPTPAMPRATGIGHVHLKVADVSRASAFYRDALGLEEQAQLPSAAFLSAGGYHHHIGLNSWHSQGGTAPPDTAPDLRLIEFELSDSAELDVLERRLGKTLEGSAEVPRTAEQMGDRCLLLRDPNRVALGFS